MLLFLPGCIGLALTAVTEGARLVDPPQPPLYAAASCFGDTINVTTHLTSSALREKAGLGKAGLVRSALHENDQEHSLIPGMSPRPPNSRMALWTELRNDGPTTVEIVVQSVDSALGPAVSGPTRIALAPRQKALLDPLWSDHANLEKLDVTITLKCGDSTEVKTLELIPPPKINDASTTRPQP